MFINTRISQPLNFRPNSVVEPLEQSVTAPTQYPAKAAIIPISRAKADLEPTELTFPSQEEADYTPKHKKKEFDDIWDDYRDAENDRLDVKTLAQLKTALGIEGDSWGRYAQLGQLVNQLDELGLLQPQVLNDLYTIKHSHSSLTLEFVAQQMNDFLEAYNPPQNEQKQVVLNGLHDIAFPSDIDQRNIGSCGAAACQMKMAIERPRSYARLLTNLAQGKSYRTTSGHSIRPNNSWRGDGNDPRNYSARMIQNALMEFAGQTNYDSSRDDDMRGTQRSEQEVMLERIFGYSIDRDSEGYMPWSDGKDDLFQYVEDDIMRGRAVNVSFDGHSVLVVGIDRTGSTPKVIINSWGEQYSMTKAQFERYVEEVRTHDDSGSDDRQVRQGRRRIIGDR